MQLVFQWGIILDNVKLNSVLEAFFDDNCIIWKCCWIKIFEENSTIYWTAHLYMNLEKSKLSQKYISAWIKYKYEMLGKKYIIWKIHSK